MIEIGNDVHSLTEFKRNSVDLLRRMKETGNPLVLTVRGKAELVVQNFQSFQCLLEMVERADSISAISYGLASIERGEGRAARDLFDELRARLGIPRDA